MITRRVWILALSGLLVGSTFGVGLAFASLSPAPLEALEQLEQLRALHHGLTIRVEPVEGESTVAVDTPEDLERVRLLISPNSLATIN